MRDESDELASLDATAQADLVRRRELSAFELVSAAIARIERVNPQLNAVIHELFEEGLERARSIDDGAGASTAPFAGVPFLLKDIGARQQGQPYCMGNKALRDAGYRSDRDTVLGARFRAAGFVTVGKTNVPEFGQQPTTQPLAFGDTRNPWDLQRSVSGSSGGSAAAVAAGLVPVAHANDGGGSIRLPAAWCGVVGFKPSRGRMPGVDDAAISPLTVEFVVARSIRDVAAVLDSTCGATPGDLYQLHGPPHAYARALIERAPRLRIGFLTKWRDVPVAQDCARAVEATCEVLQELGHRVEECGPEVLLSGPPRDQAVDIDVVENRASLKRLGAMLGRPVEAADVEPYFWEWTNPGGAVIAAEDLIVARHKTQRWVTQILDVWTQRLDVLVTPTCFSPPLPLDELRAPAERPSSILESFWPHVEFTAPFNVTGQPAVSLPLAWTEAGLPVGVQFVAQVGADQTLVNLAAELENARPWRERRPPIHA